MTATLLAMLVDDGKLRWDETLGELFPDVPMDKAYRNVTVDMLAAHQGGLPENMSDEHLWDSLWKKDSRAARSSCGGTP